MDYAGFWIRVGAYIIDGIVLWLVQAVLATMFGVSVATMAGLGTPEAAATGAATLVSLISLVIGIAYFVVLESSNWQATLGKKALGLIVTDEGGNRITWLRALGRYVAKILSAIILLIGFIMVAFTDKKQGLHDIICSTLVLKAQPGQVATDGVFD
ncbi:RDD family protein [Aurantiacibacter gangjinensis]|uniref:Uncharacterized protein n=1 Tax=Aurantiacibacter gangjinensis TaxID=502682 RepID=A0A0G9MVV6_9SPHN|nr:RDD family protein [Aurantiacibacter gangjinensis]APE26962.1 Serine/threonine protein kinase [Aurantiacibacter gangjinensis]KLE33413.1 hypothetical protein AAW01_05660 [Aurantiacibacter gangjinensis]